MPKKSTYGRRFLLTDELDGESPFAKRVELKRADSIVSFTNFYSLQEGNHFVVYEKRNDELMPSIVKITEASYESSQVMYKAALKQLKQLNQHRFLYERNGGKVKSVTIGKFEECVRHFRAPVQID